MTTDPKWDFAALAHACEVCGVTDGDKPMCFRGERWCSDDHRKQILKAESAQ